MLHRTLDQKKTQGGQAKLKEMKKLLLERLQTEGKGRCEHLKSIKASMQLAPALEQAKQLYSSLTK